MRKLLLLFILSIAGGKSFGQNVNDSFKIYFDLDIPELNAKAQHAIDSLIYNDRIINGTTITIVGYADYLGETEHNLTLSQNRAKNVKAYLQANGMMEKDIKLCIGKGEINRSLQITKDGYPTDRRVDIVVRSTLAPVKLPSGKKPTVNVKPAQPGKVYKNNLVDLDKYKPGETFVLKNIYFYPESHRVKPESIPILEQLYEIMKNNPTLKIKIEGHVCCIRDFTDALDRDNDQLNLSENRATAIYLYLADKGIDKQRMLHAGYGHSKPIVKEEITEEDAQKNRRVEIRILQK